MSTEQNPASGTPTEQNGGDKVTFTQEQQEKIQQLIDGAVGRTAAKVRGDYETKLNELTTQLETLKTSSPAKKDDDGAKDEYKRIVEEAKRETETFRKAAQDREREAQAARTEAQEIRKDAAIMSAASKIPFFNLEVVKTLTKDSVVYDAELGKHVVKGPNGQTRYDSTLENPLSLEAFYTEYAAQNKYLVRSEIGSGTGSSEASRTNVSANGRYDVKDIFGPKSDSRKASALMKDSPSEYQRLKGIARQEGLIA